jgi:hypothetical protein
MQTEVGDAFSWIWDWLLKSGLAAGLVIVVAWFARKWLLAQISESVRHEYDAKLELLRSDLQAKERQLAALRDGALAHMVSTQTAASQRRLQAVDDLWRAVTEWQRLLGAVMLETDRARFKASEFFPSDTAKHTKLRGSRPERRQRQTLPV